MEVSEQIKEIKKSFRLYMNGVASSSMREKGLAYKINWGISQVDLRNMASQYCKDEHLASALWREKSRECQLLATLLMPPENMDISMAEAWSNDINTIEMSEAIVFNLFQHISEAEQLAIKMLGNDNRLQHIASYNLVCRLLKRGTFCTQHTYDVLFAQAEIDLNTSDRQLMHSVVNCLDLIMSYSEKHTERAAQILKAIGFSAL